MPKHRKTRSEKKAMDFRRVGTTSAESMSEAPVASYQYSYTPKTPINTTSSQPRAISTTSYAFVMTDLRRTLILTSTIIVIQLILYFVTK